ncbi:dienelactone hydrolase [Sinimarinibacterium sp. CAU 1509]|uniref:dienelactone hydrolase family protein n=1 Tax=Sinimarinibacterium sp. CAU 1509 TaxID=2562283 RepID=UPI0010AC3306|nr:dienelactone hydrolase family protein [Sinimarinibacterium sp. CAU 1509]TJY58831.1 dienelactone hydrolase [Sinimarinibacterium sp. CAU 1509]
MQTITAQEIPGFERAELAPVGAPARTVYRRGSGPAVVVMTEVPGITPQVARFATRVADAGFSVYLPQLIGTPMQPLTPVTAARSMARACISREFRVLASNQSSPIVDWLRALARHAHTECGGPGVGAIGMCLTGNFALAMMLDAPVIAPVLSQPSLPVAITPARRSGLHASPAELKAAHDKIDHHGARILGLRFNEDPMCPPQRFARLRAEFGDAFEAIELPSSCANPDALPPAHSVLTTHLIDAAGEPTRAALDRTLAFLREQLQR